MPSENGLVLPELLPEEREAMEYIRDIKAFYIHAIHYGVVMVGLTILDIVSSPGYFWVIWPVIG